MSRWPQIVMNRIDDLNAALELNYARYLDGRAVASLRGGAVDEREPLRDPCLECDGMELVDRTEWDFDVFVVAPCRACRPAAWAERQAHRAAAEELASQAAKTPPGGAGEPESGSRGAATAPQDEACPATVRTGERQTFSLASEEEQSR